MADATHFTNFDYVVIGVMVFSCVFAYFRGLVREILSLVAWVGAGIITIYYFPSAAENLKTHFRNPTVAAALAGIGIYVLALIFFSIINVVLIRSLKGGEPGVLDNLLGLLFGAARGAFIISLGFFLLSFALKGREEPDWLKESVTRPYAEKGAAMLEKVAPDALLELTSLQKKTQEEVQGTPPQPTPPTPASVDSDNPANPPQNIPGQDTGYNRTTTQQLDRLIDSTGKQ